MNYKQFCQQYDFVMLGGLKGQEKVCVIQDKNNFRIYDFEELKETGDDIDSQKEFCNLILSIQHPNLLKMHTYSYVFKQETHGEPFCQFFLVYDYCECELEGEIENLKKTSKYYKTEKLLRLFESMLLAVAYYHSMGLTHGCLTPKMIRINEAGEYKLVPNMKHRPRKKQSEIKHMDKLRKDMKEKNDKIVRNLFLETGSKKLSVFKKEKKPSNLASGEAPTKSAAEEKRIAGEKAKMEERCYINLKTGSYPSPEKYAKERSRNTLSRVKTDSKKSEVFSLGMLILSVAILDDLEPAYDTFKMNFDYLEDRLYKCKVIHGSKIQALLSLMLTKDPDTRLTCAETCEYLMRLKDEREEDGLASPPPKKKVLKKRNSQNYDETRRRSSLKMSVDSMSVKENLEEEQYWEKRIFTTLPQEYQNEIDRRVNDNIKRIEEKYNVEMFTSGNRHQGETNEQNKPHGWGVFWWSNGERYEGKFISGKYDGDGIYYWPSGTKHYGIFSNGEITGLGVRYYPDGGIYYGQWLKGKTHGKGTFYWPIGARFSGTFVDDNISGKGTLVWPQKDGKTVRRYEGLWKDNGIKGLVVEQYDTNEITTFDLTRR